MDLADQLLDRLPAKRPGNFRSYIQIDTRHEDMPARLDHSGYASQTRLCVGWLHMAEEPVGHNNILKAKRASQLRITGISARPRDSLPQPIADDCQIALNFEHFRELVIRETPEYRSTLVHAGFSNETYCVGCARGVGSVLRIRLCTGIHSTLRELHNLLRNIYSIHAKPQVRTSGANSPHNRIHLRPFAACENRDIYIRARGFRIQKAAD